MLKEIGSEFWDFSEGGSPTDLPARLSWNGDIKTPLSGRAALDWILRDASTTKVIRKAYLPSYCCETMIQPFAKNGIQIFFYDVMPKKEDGFDLFIDKTLDVDVVIVMDYFGFRRGLAERAAESFANKGILLIEDATQTLLSRPAYYPKADYVFASLRKWFAIPDGALVAKLKGNFANNYSYPTNDDFVRARLAAFEMKREYIEDRADAKEEYLARFRAASEILQDASYNYSMSEVSRRILNSTTVETLIHQRNVNANYLLERITDVSGIRAVFGRSDIADTPLFVPILVQNGLRDELCRHLRNNGVYCPIHWPLSPFHSLKQSSLAIYQDELSLICDQRYGRSEMDKIIDCVEDFFRHRNVTDEF